MASLKFSMVLLVASSILIQCALGSIVCEELPKDACAFAISSAGKRCLLEKYSGKGGAEYQCRTSEVVVEGMSDYIETDECVRACGVDRASVGISSDSLMESNFASKLCSAPCYQNCPNIVDLYFNLAAGEGVFLPDLCAVTRSNPRRTMAELLSSGAAPGPVSGGLDSTAFADSPAASASLADSPAPSPVSI
ncbi:hypothetical protein QJS04_geneDACA007625 [Acorus gramineus]|uniref:PAR1 protein n=1 Tax=Acorus gramineus TaxID=55184 RepID=A0AAV9B4G3_ACOGR|nr:hypothetical protein QJS04_geneDACA007625 [Acorus gramineus]